MLDVARDLTGFPIVITSGFRTTAQNAAAGGVDGSEHTKGLAVDIHKPIGAFEAAKLAWALGRAGFRRVLWYSNHLHVDLSESKEQNIFIDYGVSH